MPLRFAITKSTAQGETMVTDVCQWNPVTGEVLHTIDEMAEMADEALKLTDMRLMQMNTRVLEAESLEQYCTSAEWNKILSIIDVMCGRQSADLVRRRWQSEREETAELEAGRAEAAQQSTLACCQCHQTRAVGSYFPSSTDPLAQVCSECKLETSIQSNDNFNRDF